ncbi:SURF4 family-domain-containing protein [Gongronella butleri]|nr:SURF4 family-domain-containing protein [Gongronella butleri]
MPGLKQSMRSFSSSMEHGLDRIGRPLKPFISCIARFLIVATFLEDALRLSYQWEEQRTFMENRRGISPNFAQAFLLGNVVMMMLGSLMIIFRKRQGMGACMLMVVVISQAVGYGLIFDVAFFLRNLSVLGGLTMVISDGLVQHRQVMFGALPQISENDKRRYFQLSGRLLLVLLFLGTAFHGQWTIARGIVSVLNFLACIMVAVGFKAKYSAVFLVLFLSVSNVLINNFWTIRNNQFRRDFLKFDFFQTLSTIGGFLLLASVGPGGYSFDEKKKAF